MPYPPDDLRGQQPGTHVAGIIGFINAAANALQPGASSASKAAGYLALAEAFREFALALPPDQAEHKEVMGFATNALKKGIEQGRLMVAGPS
jgi:hypothetical protein